MYRKVRPYLASAAATLIAMTALSLTSTGSLGWMRILLLHTTLGAMMIWLVLRPTSGLNVLLLRIGARVEPLLAIGRGSGVTRTLCQIALVLAAGGELFRMMHFVLSAPRTAMIVPHLVALPLIFLFPLLARSVRLAWRGNLLGTRILLLNHVLLALCFPITNFYHLGVRDGILFPALCSAGKPVSSWWPSSRYGLVCEAEANRCSYIWNGLFAGNGIAQVDLTSGEERYLEVPFSPQRLVQGEDGLLYFVGYLANKVGGLAVVDPKPFQVVRQLTLRYPGYWLEVEPTRGRYFVTDDTYQGRGRGITIYDRDGNVFRKISRTGFDHLALVGDRVGLASTTGLALLDVEGNLVIEKGVFGAVDLVYDEPRKRLLVVTASARLKVVDPGSLTTGQTYPVPFGSRYLYIDRANDLLFIGNPILPSVTIFSLADLDHKVVLTDVPIGIRAFGVVGKRLFYTTACGVYQIDLAAALCPGSGEAFGGWCREHG